DFETSTATVNSNSRCRAARSRHCAINIMPFETNAAVAAAITTELNNSLFIIVRGQTRMSYESNQFPNILDVPCGRILIPVERARPLCSGVQAMRISADVVLPTNLTSDEEYQIIGTDDPGKGRCIQYQQEIVFKRIVLFATRPLAKVMGFHPATTLHISWGSSATRAEACSDFLEYLRDRGLPE